MQVNKIFYKILKMNIFSILFLFNIINIVEASQSSGTVLSNTYSTSLVCSDATCSTTTSHRINWKPTTGNGILPITIVDGVGIRGHAWGEKLGWINFNITGGNGITPTSINTNTGAVTGYAWSQNSGWINFSPTAGNGITPVTINSSGEFTGYAWVSGSNGGWVKFDCAGSATTTCVKTDWVPVPSRTVTPTPGGGGGGGGGGGLGFVIPTGTTTVVDNKYLNQKGKQYQPTDFSNDYRADINDSGLVDIFDFNILMSKWAQIKKVDKSLQRVDRCKDIINADINCDGQVDTLDFNLLMVYWGQYIGSEGEILLNKIKKL